MSTVEMAVKKAQPAPGADRQKDASVRPKQTTGLFAKFRASITRGQFFAALCVLACANGLLGRILLAATTDGLGAFLTADISVIVFFACFAGISKFLEDGQSDLTSRDLTVGFAVFLCIALPIFTMSWIALTGLSLYVLVSAKGSQEHRGGALIMLALTVPMLWSRLLFQFFAPTILAVDSFLAAFLLGSHQSGNLVSFADDSGYMIVLPACSSLANMSLAFLCWISVTQWAGHRWTVRDLGWTFLACASVIAANVTRIALTGLNQEYYHMIHGTVGSQVFGVIILAIIVGISVFSARREIFPRA